jgi:hypothetical protein
MDALKGLVSTAKNTTTSFFTSPPDVETKGRSSTHVMFSNVRRRTTESILQRFGKADGPMDDGDYTSRRARILELQGIVVRARKGAGNALDAIRALSASTAVVGECVASSYAARSSSPPSVLAPTLFRDSLRGVEAARNAHVDTALISGVLVPLDAVIAELTALEPLMLDRENLRVDLAARERKVREMKAGGSGGEAPTRVLEKEGKVERTRQVLAEATAALYARFQRLECFRLGNADVVPAVAADAEGGGGGGGVDEGGASLSDPLSTPGGLGAVLARMAAVERAFFDASLRALDSAPRELPSVAPSPDMVADVGGAGLGGPSSSYVPPPLPTATVISGPGGVTTGADVDPAPKRAPSPLPQQSAPRGSWTAATTASQRPSFGAAAAAPVGASFARGNGGGSFGTGGGASVQATAQRFGPTTTNGAVGSAGPLPPSPRGRPRAQGGGEEGEGEGG